MAAFGKILFIDDDIITTTVCKRMMTLVDFCGEFIACEDGRKAKDYLMGNAANLPNIIFVDLNMHIMNGWEFIEWFNEWAAQINASIPIYVFSSSLYKEDQEKAQAHKTAGYITKPITDKHLSAIIKKYSA